jgi:esterase
MSFAFHARRSIARQRSIISHLYSQYPGYTAQDVVQLQHSEFLPTSTTDTTHPPVIILHGLLGNKRNFASLANSLSTQLKNSRPIYTLDLRNHGENTHDWRGTMSYSEMSRDILAFMDKKQFSEAVIVGHSMGGKVAQSLALMHPDRVAGLVVLDIAPVRYYSDEKNGAKAGDGSAWKVVEEIVRSVAELNLEGCKTKRDVDAILRDGILEDPALRAFVLTNLEQIRSEDESEPPLKWKIHWEGIVNELDRIAGFDAHDEPLDELPLDDDNVSSEQLSRYKYEGDVFFIHGGASRFVRHSHISTIANFFPNHMLTTIRGVGHWVHAEAPDDTIALLKKYLDR